MMQYISSVVLLLALGTSARPQWPRVVSDRPNGFFARPSSGSLYPKPTSNIGAESCGVAVPSVGSALPVPISNSTPTYPFGNGSVSYGVPGTSISAPSGPAPSVTFSESTSSDEASSTVASSVGAVSGAASSAATATSSPALASGTLSSGGNLPASSGTSALSAVHTVAAGKSFDCGMIMYDRGVDCTGQEEGGDSDAVFMLEKGASLSNCIIGPNQIEGVHCQGGCTLTNVWWSAVCEDAFTIKVQDSGETTTINGGGAFGAEDKVLQHNGGGTLSVTGFTVDNFGKVYRSCGNCDEMFERHVIIHDITATSGSEIAGINSNYGDTATLTNIKVSDVDDICVTYTGNDTGDEPEENGTGPSKWCIYDESDISAI